MSWDEPSAAGRAVVFPDSIGSFRASSTVLGGSESSLKRCLTVSIVLLINATSALVLRLFALLVLAKTPIAGSAPLPDRALLFLRAPSVQHGDCGGI